MKIYEVRGTELERFSSPTSWNNHLFVDQNSLIRGIDEYGSIFQGRIEAFENDDGSVVYNVALLAADPRKTRTNTCYIFEQIESDGVSEHGGKYMGRRIDLPNAVSVATLGDTVRLTQDLDRIKARSPEAHTMAHLEIELTQVRTSDVTRS